MKPAQRDARKDRDRDAHHHRGLWTCRGRARRSARHGRRRGHRHRPQHRRFRHGCRRLPAARRCAATAPMRTSFDASAPKAPTGFFALTEGDNRNVLAAQLAAETFGVPKVVAKINDPVRADGIRRVRHRDRLPHEHDGRGAGRLRRPAGRRRAPWRPPPDRASPRRMHVAAPLRRCRAHRSWSEEALMYVDRRRRRQGRLLPDQGVARGRP